MSRNVFITGGSGFIGTQLVEIALRDGCTVRIFDTAAPSNPAHRELWIEGDVRDALFVARAISDFTPDLVLHLASDTDVSITRIEQFQTTIDGTANILAAIHDLPLTRFVHTSTQFVVKPGVEPRDERYLAPYTVYGEAKAEAEKLVWSAGLQMPWIIVRPVIIWGPGHPSFADHIFRHIVSRRYLHPVGAPITRAFGYVENVAQQIYTLAILPESLTDRHVFYVGDDTINYDVWADAFAKALTGKRARRIPLRVLKLLGRAGDLIKKLGLPTPIDSGRAFRMSTSSRVDLSHTHALTGVPAVDFDRGVRETVAWLRRENPARFGRGDA
jgi:nucleoside-diphosphate-sugar epimerase